MEKTPTLAPTPKTKGIDIHQKAGLEATSLKFRKEMASPRKSPLQDLL
jgi:hypothetical protein